MVSIDAVALIVGIVYGYVKPGKTEKGEIIKKGATYGIVLGIVLAVLNLIFRGGILLASATAVGTVIAIVYLTVLFVIGAWIGDFIEERVKK